MRPKIKIHPKKDWMKIQTLEMHTGGEPLRIITDGLPEIPGKTILKKRKYFKENYDHIRTSTMWEPRGHADMYGAILTEPVTEDGDFGVFFLHNEGYSTMCGHGMVSFNLVRRMVVDVQNKRLSLQEAAIIMAKPCVCGIFNPKRAENLLRQYIDGSLVR